MKTSHIELREKDVFWAVVALLAMVAMAPRVYFAGKYGLWTDEIGAARTFAGTVSFWDYLNNGLLRDTVPPLYNLVGYMSVRLAEDQDFAFRLPSVVFSSLTVFSMAALGRAIHGSAAGLFAALFGAIAPVAIRYGYDARPYSMEVFMLTLLWFILHQACDRGWTPWHATAFFGCLVLACLSHYFALFTVAALIAVYFGVPYLKLGTAEKRQPTTILMGSVAVVVIIAAFHFWLISCQQVSRSDYFTDYSPGFLWQYFSKLWQSDVIGPDTPMWGSINLLTPVLALLVVMGGISIRRDIRLLAMSLVLLFAVVGIPLVAMLSRNLLSVRFSMFALPVLLLYAACGMAYLLHLATYPMRGTRSRTALPLAISGLSLCAAVLVILALDTKRALQLPYFHEWREKANYYNSLLRRGIVDHAITGNSIAARNMAFYTPHPITVNIQPAFITAITNATKPIAFFDVPKNTVAELYNAARTSSTLIEITGVIPKIVFAWPAELPSPEMLEFALTEHSHIHRYVVPERRSWVYSQLGQLARRAQLEPMANLSFQLLFLHGESDIDRGYALWQMGSPGQALSYYENYFNTNPDRNIRDYMITQYKQLQEELRKK